MRLAFKFFALNIERRWSMVYSPVVYTYMTYDDNCALGRYVVAQLVANNEYNCYKIQESHYLHKQ